MDRHMSVKLVVKAANLSFYHILYSPAEKLVRRFSSVGQHPFFNPLEFVWIPRIEAGWPTMRDELRALLRERERIPSCHETTRLIETIPGMKPAFFSILGPRKHIPEHRGPYAGVLRYHLGLIVPRQKEACRIRVDSDIAQWEEGRSVVFDDTYPHEVWNDTDEERVVLFVDFARPLSFPVSILNDAVIWLFSRSGTIQEIVENVDEWNRQTGTRTTGEPSVIARTSES